MSASLWQAGTLGLAIAAGLTGGMTFAFSNFIMKAFDRLAAPEAVRAMQAINVAVYNPLFMLIFMGTGGFAVAIALGRSLAGGGVEPWLLVGTLVYVFGVCFVTGLGNVPLNNALATVTEQSMKASSWSDFARPWLLYNHVRTVAAAVASLAFMVAAFR